MKVKPHQTFRLMGLFYIKIHEGFAPNNTYVLVDEGVYIWVFNLRHCLNDFLREGAGHIGYCISQKYRGKGYLTR